jgi:rare lipoprotein A (peptidoglycan hydrolase)
VLACPVLAYEAKDAPTRSSDAYSLGLVRPASQVARTQQALCLGLALVGVVHSACFATESPPESPESRRASSAAPSRARDGRIGSVPREAPPTGAPRQVPVGADQAPVSQAQAAEGPVRPHESESFAELAELGRTARVKARWRGQATYYSDRLAGNLMASGIEYDPERPYAAHRTLPLGSLIRVVRLKTGAAVVLRVLDRGPFGDRRRIVDVSRAAAERLGLLRVGVADVRVELLTERR